MISGFFPPQFLGLPRQEKMTDHRDVQVTHHGLILADLEMRIAQLAFLVFQDAFDRPAREGDVEPSLEIVFKRVPDQEPFFFVGMQRIIGPDEMVAAENLAIAMQPERSGLDLPDHRPFLGVLDVEGGPFLTRHRSGGVAKFLDAACRMARRVAGVVEPTA